MNKPINMAHALQDGMLHTPKMCLEDCLENDIDKRGAFEKGKKLMIVALDDDSDRYEISWCQAGMTMSQMISLCEVLKVCLLEQMGY